jgi:hypothetical protein
MVGLIRGTKNGSGLGVDATVTKQQYAKGRKVPDDEMKRLWLTHHDPCPKWNYTICPRKNE